MFTVHNSKNIFKKSLCKSLCKLAFWSNWTHSLKYHRSTTSGCTDIGVIVLNLCQKLISFWIGFGSSILRLNFSFSLNWENRWFLGRNKQIFWVKVSTRTQKTCLLMSNFSFSSFPTKYEKWFWKIYAPALTVWFSLSQPLNETDEGVKGTLQILITT